MGLLDRVTSADRDRRKRARKQWSESPFWNVDVLRSPLLASTGRPDHEQIEADFEGYVEWIYKRSGPAFSLINLRQKVFSQARFIFRELNEGRPGDLFWTDALAKVVTPWVGGTTGDLLGRALVDADLAGNGFIANYAGRFRRMRPDRVTIVLGSRSDLDADMPLGYLPLDIELLGYLYSPRALGGDDDVFLLPEQVAHFAPVPDPLAHFRGMSWLTPILREISADTAATKHKLAFFENAATPQIAVRFDPSVDPDMARRFKAIMEENHSGPDNSFRTLFVGGGADVTPLTFDLRQLDFKAVQGGGETRLAQAAGVPPSVVGFAEGLQGSALNAGNYGVAKRSFVDATLRPLWANIAGSLANLIDVPEGAELWFDDRDIPFLREDAKDAAEIFDIRVRSLTSLVKEGYEPDTAEQATSAESLKPLEHTGMVSVQLQPPGAGQTTQPADPAEES